MTLERREDDFLREFLGDPTGAAFRPSEARIQRALTALPRRGVSRPSSRATFWMAALLLVLACLALREFPRGRPRGSAPLDRAEREVSPTEWLFELPEETFHLTTLDEEPFLESTYTVALLSGRDAETILLLPK